MLALTPQRGSWSRHGELNPDSRHTRTLCFPLNTMATGASDRTRTGISGLEARGPSFGRHSRYLVRPAGIDPAPPRWQRGVPPSHPGRTEADCSSAHVIASIVKEPVHMELVGSKGIEPRAPVREGRVYGPPADHPHVLPVGDSARIRTRTHECWNLGCSRYTTLPSHETPNAMSRHTSPVTWARLPWQVRRTTKKAFQGIALEGLIRQ